MKVGSNKSYHSLKESVILHDNFDKFFAKAKHHKPNNEEIQIEHINKNVGHF